MGDAHCEPTRLSRPCFFARDSSLLAASASAIGSAPRSLPELRKEIGKPRKMLATLYSENAARDSGVLAGLIFRV